MTLRANSTGATHAVLTQSAGRHHVLQVTLQRTLGTGLGFLLVAAGAVTFSIPFLWMVMTSLKSETQLAAHPNTLLPAPILWQNYAEAWFGQVPMMRYLGNSLAITVVPVITTVLVSSLVAFSFARLRWPGRDVWFLLMLCTLMLPGQVTLIPKFILFVKLGWINTFLPWIVQAFFIPGGPFWVFLLRQYYLTIPLELDEAAIVDGAGVLDIYRRIMLPLAKPALVVVALFSFQGHWNDFLGPLLYLRSQHLYPLTLGLYAFRTGFSIEWPLMMAASMLLALPGIIIFFVGQRWFVEGITMTGIRG